MIQSLVASPPRAWCLFNAARGGTRRFRSLSIAPAHRAPCALLVYSSLRLSFSPHLPRHNPLAVVAMAMWSRSDVRQRELDALVEVGLLCPFTKEGQEWLLPEPTADRPASPPGHG